MTPENSMKLYHVMKDVNSTVVDMMIRQSESMKKMAALTEELELVSRPETYREWAETYYIRRWSEMKPCKSKQEALGRYNFYVKEEEDDHPSNWSRVRWDDAQDETGYEICRRKTSIFRGVAKVPLDNAIRTMDILVTKPLHVVELSCYRCDKSNSFSIKKPSYLNHDCSHGKDIMGTRSFMLYSGDKQLDITKTRSLSSLVDFDVDTRTDSFLGDFIEKEFHDIKIQDLKLLCSALINEINFRINKL